MGINIAPGLRLPTDPELAGQADDLSQIGLAQGQRRPNACGRHKEVCRESVGFGFDPLAAIMFACVPHPQIDINCEVGNN